MSAAHILGPIEHYLPVVRRNADRIARRVPANVELDDLVQAGMIGLIEAAERFDQARGIPFEAFATRRVRGAMLDELRTADWAPRSLRHRQRQLTQAAQRLGHTLQRAPRASEVAESLGISVADYHSTVAGAQRTSRLDAAFDDDDASPALADGALCGSDDPQDEASRRDLVAFLGRAEARLTAREQEVLRLYYQDELNLRQVGLRLGVSESRASALHAQAVERLRGWFGLPAATKSARASARSA